MKKLVMSIVCALFSIPGVFASHYDIAFPVLIDAGINPYNRVPQQGQTIVSDGGVGYNTYDTHLINQQTGISHIPGVQSDMSFEKPFSERFLCLEPLRDGKPMGHSKVYVNPFRIPGGGPHALVALKMQDGWIDGQPRMMRYVRITHGLPKNLPNSVVCGFDLSKNNFGFAGAGIDFRAGDTVTYRVQYGANTSIRTHIPVPISPYQDIRILSNYASNTPSGTGIILIPNSLDACGYGTSTCKTTSIIATSLNGTKTDIMKMRPIYWEDYKKRHGGMTSEYFSIPADTATIDFVYE